MNDESPGRSVPIWAWGIGGLVAILVLIAVINFVVSQVIAAIQMIAVIALLTGGGLFLGRRFVKQRELAGRQRELGGKDSSH